MTDPFDILRERLVAAAAAAPPAGRRRLRPIVGLVAALLVTGTAAATVVSLTSEESAPLSGRVPSAPDARDATASDYVIELLPELSAGRTGWCATLVLRRGRRPIAGGEGCGPAPAAAAPLIVAGRMISTNARATSVSYAVVDVRVAGLRLSVGRRIVPRRSSALPNGWKGAVWFSPGGVEPAMPTLLDAAGREISTTANERAGTRHAGTAALPTVAVDPAAPPHRRCAIRVPPGAGLRAVSERVVTAAPRQAPHVLGRAFRACASAVLHRGPHRFVAAVLVDARDAAARAAPLPGRRPHPAAPGIVDAGGQITARRAGPAWLVVRGIGAGERLRVLRALGTGEL